MKDLFNVKTMLFTPGNRPERFEKAKDFGANGVVIDLEDAISLSEKDKARDIVIQYFKSHTTRMSGFLRCLRINSIKTAAGLKDISALIDNKITPDIILLPKAEYAAEIIILDNLLNFASIPYIALIETSTGLKNSDDIASCSANVKALCFGGGDLAADLGAELAWEPMFAARSQVVRAAAISGIAVLDVPYLKLQDPDDSGVLEETKRVKALGFTGKFAIHPKHIKPILETFTPTAEEMKSAKRILDAYEKAKGNVCEIDGKMIDVPIVRSAQKIMSRS